MEYDPTLASANAWYWAYFNHLQLQGGPFMLEGHEYQVDMLTCRAQNQVGCKGAQMCFTENAVIKTLHGHIHGHYPKGTLYLFPSANDVTDFSKGRFNPLINDNPEMIGSFVKDTDAAHIKRVGKGMLYLRGARSTKKIEGMKKSSTKLKSVPVDRIVFDEYDEMEPHMVTLALERVSHSEIQETFKLSTPTIPDYGVDAEFKQSDMRHWFIKCDKCGKETCLELEFPAQIEIDKKGKGFRTCRRCRSRILPQNGTWRPLYEGRDLVGWYISQLCSKYVDPGEVLRLWENPPEGNRAEIENSKLGRAYVDAENRLTKNDVYACCGYSSMAARSHDVNAMGIDVRGSELHVVVGHPTMDDKKYEIEKIAVVSSFGDIYDIAASFNVKCAAIDMEPETRKAREFQRNAPFKVYLVDYAERLKVKKRTDEREGIVVVRRTEITDQTHWVFYDGLVKLPRRCTEIDRYATEMSNMAKILKEDKDTGSKTYHYISLGADHYRHATNYWIMACEDPLVQAAAVYHIHTRASAQENNAAYSNNDGLLH